MVEIYKYVRPCIWGIPTLEKLNKGLKSFAKSKDIILSSKSLSKPKDIDIATNFIKEGLMMDSPVLMLTWNSKTKNLRYQGINLLLSSMVILSYLMVECNK